MHSTPFPIAGQTAWHHDEGHRTGTFHTFDALQLDEGPPRKVHVYLPRAHNGPFPVLVVLDGDTTFWRGGPFGQTWDLAGLLDELGDTVAPVMVVAVHPHQRNREYTHVDWSAGRHPHGGLAEHAGWLAGPLRRFLADHYPVRDEDAAILGSSHGGLAAFWAATRHPDAFRAAASLSPSLFSGLDLLAGDGVRRGPHGPHLARAPIVSDAAAVLADPGRRPKLFLSWGLRRDGGAHNSVVEALATARGRELAGHLRGLGWGPDELHVHEDPHGEHTEPTWRRHAAAFLTWRFPGLRGA